MTPTPWATAAASPTASPTPTPTPTPDSSPTPSGPATFPLAVVVRYDDTRLAIATQALTAALASGSMAIPCELTYIGLGSTSITISPATKCLPANRIEAFVHETAGTIGLMPPGLVTPSVKVLEIGTADLFGAPSHRGQVYQLYGEAAIPADWATYDQSQIRTLISTGDTCPDRGVSDMAVVNKKGWNWVLDGGTVRYRRLTKSDMGWDVPVILRNNDPGKLRTLIADNDISVNDFECPMVSPAIQHDTGTVFNIDPRVASLLATKGGLKVVTLGSNHITDAKQTGVLQTLQYLDAAGIKHTGAGKTLADALTPAVVDVRGLKFAFVGWDSIEGSAAATAARPGVAPMTDDNVCNSLRAARQAADVVIAMPQWGWPEYHATITKDQVTQRALFYQCGADGILGSGTHWASWVSIQPDVDGPKFAIGSHGNFLFDQSWSRQTMEGVIVDATFYGRKLVQFRLHPYVVVQGAQPNLLEPTDDGAYVLNQVWSNSTVP
jgi:hypothetical protein